MIPAPRGSDDDRRGVDSTTERLMELLQILHPGRDREWLIIWLNRAAYYYDHDGDMRRCPYVLPQEETAA